MSSSMSLNLVEGISRSEIAMFRLFLFDAEFFSVFFYPARHFFHPFSDGVADLIRFDVAFAEVRLFCKKLAAIGNAPTTSP